MTTGQRMKIRRKEIGLSAENLAELLGVSPATIYRYENGDIEKVPGDRLGPIAEALHTSPAFLMGWDDATDASLPSNIIPMPEMRQIPLIGSIACGAPVLADEHIEDYLNIPRQIHADFALTCKGDSMINARIFDGDIVYIRQQDTVDNGEIAAVLIDGEATLKRVQLFEDHISLEPNGSAMFQTNFGLETLEDGTFKTGNAFDFVYAITIEYTDVKGIGVYKSKFTIHLNINIDVENKPCVFIESTSNTLLEQ